MNDTKAIFKSIFEKMIDTGLFIAEDPDVLAYYESKGCEVNPFVNKS